MIIVLAGTSEGREAAALLQNRGWPVLATATSPLGAELLRLEGIRQVWQGSFDDHALPGFIEENQAWCLVDATHPFARTISRQAMEAARQTGIPYLRLEREAGLIPEQGVIKIEQLEELDAHIKPGMTVFSTLGSKHLPQLLPLVEGKQARLVARVLPLDSVLQGLARLGFKEEQIVALRGPFSEEENLALFKSHQADLIVSKESGPAGGIEAKITAARKLGVPIAVWARPAMQYPVVFRSAAGLLEYIEKKFGRCLPMTEGVVIIAHGSKRKEANDEIRNMVALIQAKDRDKLYQAAFLQFDPADLGQAIEQLLERDVQKVVIMPYFLITGNHISVDIPELIKAEQQKHPSLAFLIAKHLNGHPGMVDIVLDRIRECIPLKKVD